MNTHEIISVLGGTSQVAKLCGVSPAAVAQWRHKGIPKDKLMLMGAQLEKVTHGKFSRKEHFPDNYKTIWTDL